MITRIVNLFKIDVSGNRIFGLDLLRCAAIFFVLLTHFLESIKPNNLTHFYYKYLYIDGVGLFFVLSGFLIGTILTKDFIKYGISFSTLLNFWKRRWFRTLPNYYLVMLFVLTFNYFYKNIDISFADVLRRITFTQNFYSLDENYYKKFPEGWSLAVEEWFYLLFPLLIFIVHRVTKKSYLPTYIYRLSLIILLVFSSFRFYDELILGNPFKSHLVIFRLDAILYGVVGATIAYFHKNFWIKIKIPALIISIMLLLINRIYIHDIRSLSLILDSVFVLGLLPFLSSFKINRPNFITQCITWISLISYSLYLLNLFIIDNLINPFTYLYSDKNSIKFFLFLSFCMLFSTLLYKYIELPIIKWYNRQNQI